MCRQCCYICGQSLHIIGHWCRSHHVLLPCNTQPLPLQQAHLLQACSGYCLSCLLCSRRLPGQQCCLGWRLPNGCPQSAQTCGSPDHFALLGLPLHKNCQTVGSPERSTPKAISTRTSLYATFAVRPTGCQATAIPLPTMRRQTNLEKIPFLTQNQEAAFLQTLPGFGSALQRLTPH